MSGKRKIRKVRSRLIAGIFCVSLFLADMTTVMPAWAQEMVQADDLGEISDQTDREENADNPVMESNEEDDDNANDGKNPEKDNNAGDTPDLDADDPASDDTEPGAGDEGFSGEPDTGDGQETDEGDQEDREEDTEASEEDCEEPDEDDIEDTETEGEGTSVSENDAAQDSVPENDMPEGSASIMSLLAAQDNIASGTYGDITWVIDAGGKLTVEGTGEFADPSSVGSNRIPWVDYRSSIKQAVVNVTGMTDASWMFYYCRNLTNIDFKDFDTSRITNMEYMFSDCSSLTSLDLSSFDTRQTNNMKYMFLGCKSLTTLNVKKFHTEQVTDMQGMFSGCSSLQNLDVGGFDTGKVSNMSYMFSKCSSLTSLDVSHFDTGNVTSMQAMFSDCSSLLKLDLANFNTGSVTNMHSVFDGCSSLTGLDLSGFDTSQVTGMAEMFKDCKKLKSLNIDRFNTGKVSGSMAGMFSGCSSLTSINVSSFDTSNVGAMSDMFHGCSSLTSLDVSNFNTGMVSSMDNMFYGCSSLTGLDVSNFDTARVQTMNSMFYGCSSLTSLDVSNFDTGRTRLMSSMFWGCSSLTSLDVSNFKVNTTQNGLHLESMFRGCSNLTDLKVGSIVNDKATSMGHMFADCKSLTTLDLSGFDTCNVTSLGGLFYRCTSLREIDLSGFDTAKVTDMSTMFEGCMALTELDLSNFDTAKVTNMSRTFNGCSGLQTLDLSNFDCSKLTYIDKMLSLQPLSGYSQTEEFAATLIYTPRNVTGDCELPGVSSETVHAEWYDANGEKHSFLPKNLDRSMVLCRDKVPDLKPGITAKKKKTSYLCGDIINTDDITVFYTVDGNRTLVTEGFTTNSAEIDMSVPGVKKLIVTYIPEGGEALNAEIELTVRYALQADSVSVKLAEERYVYTSEAVEPEIAEVTVTVGADGAAQPLTVGADYTVAYRNNVHAGENTAEVVITGQGIYSGSVIRKFTIMPAALTIKADDMTVGVGEKLFSADYGYTTDKLLGNDKLKKGPSFTFQWNGNGKTETADMDDRQGEAETVDTSHNGTYTVTPKDADAGSDYGEITYISGTLTVTEERVTYTVQFDSMGHGSDFVKSGIKAGSLLELTEEERAPKEEGYLFGGWYRDRTFDPKSAWNFDTDIVQENMTLYACWLTHGINEGGLKLFVQEIPDLTYTGSARKPAVTVYDSDGRTLLKAGRDYTVKYVRNTDAVTVGGDGTPVHVGGTAKVTNPGKSNEEITNVIGEFTKDHPYVMITGKGNYAETVYQNFSILPANIAADDMQDGNAAEASDIIPLADGFTLKYTDQFEAKANKTAKIITSFKHKKALKENKDYTYSVQDENGHDVVLAQGKLPLSAGTYTLTITGKGNYTGTVARALYVAEKQQLMKNASITYTKTIKAESAESLADGIRQAGITVKISGKELPESAYEVSYYGNHAVGTATMTVTGKDGYVGAKSVNFKITGIPFNAKTIEVQTYEASRNEKDWKASMPYTGKAVTQNKVTLTTRVSGAGPTAGKLTYGKDYTITYKNNVKNGTAVMIFTGRPESGFSGSFQKNFKITRQYLAADMFRKALPDGTFSSEQKELALVSNDENKHNITVRWDEDAVYSKSGAALSFMLKNAEGVELKQGTDYTVSYKDHKAATKTGADPTVISGSKQPVMTIKGKGNYAGTLTVQFQIIPASIASEDLAVTMAQVQKKGGMKFKDFKLKITDGKTVLKAGVDYTVDESGCTPEIIQAYADSLGSAVTAPEPKVVLKGAGSYGMKGVGGTEVTREISLADYIYTTKLTAKNLKVEVTGDRTYTGQNVEPAVKVSYYQDNNAAKQDAKGVELKAGTDYQVTYGSKNTAAGKKKGSVTITGAGIYGGSVTVKFDIEKKRIY